MPLTEGQLKSKRDEFWDTAPAFEGKAEIWAALKAATEATEMQPEPDYQLAQVQEGTYLNLQVVWTKLHKCYLLSNGFSGQILRFCDLILYCHLKCWTFNLCSFI